MKLGVGVNISPRVVIYNPENLVVGDYSRIDDFCIISCGEGLIIGSHVHIAAYTALFGAAGIIMEDFSAISSHSVIYSKSDDYSGETMSNPTVPEKYKNVEGGLVTLKRHVLVGEGTVIMPGVTIGEGTAVAAKSFVKRDCLPWSIYAGVPAKWIKERSQNLLRLEKEFLNGSGNL